MKENFVICIESLHIGDQGDQENVRTGLFGNKIACQLTINCVNVFIVLLNWRERVLCDVVPF
jgi:hypothetical protein